MQPVSYNPGIPGFVKAHRHPSGASLVMSRARDEVIWVYWAKRLHHTTVKVHPMICFSLDSAERFYAYMLKWASPPDAAKCDYQRDRVYNWEDDNICPSFQKLSWRGCQRFARQVWREVGSGSLKLTNIRRTRDAISMHGEIHLPEHFWRKPIILHEIAHELNKGKQHGPSFVSTYIDLCVQFLKFNREFLEITADGYGINF